MALSTAQKNEIHLRAKAGESGSALALEFKVSASLVSRLKNHYSPEDEGSSSTEGKVQDSLPAQKILVSSPNITSKEYTTTAATLGEFLDEIQEDRNVEGVFRSIKKKQRVELTKMSDPLPRTDDGSTAMLVLIAIKGDGGF